MHSIKLLTKYVALIALVAAVFGPFGVLTEAQTAQAATCDATTPGATYIPNTVTGGGYYTCPNGTVTNGTTGQSQQGPADTTSCSGITGCMAAMVYYIGPGFASWVASWAAYFFDFIVRISLDSGAYALGFLTTSWGIVLSLANMFFIFILIYAAFSIMLRAETARTMQTLAWVIAIALVVNFSFFFTRVVIDAGNILGVQFYNAVAYGQNIPSISSGGTSIPDITKPIMSAIAVDQLLGGQSFAAVSAALGGSTSVFSSASWGTLLVFTVVFLFAAVFFWVLAVALLMVGLKFFLRVVGLWLILVASPLAFVAQTVSGTRKFFQQWLRSLLGLSMYPAVFLFMFWVLNSFAAQLGGGLSLLGINGSAEAIKGTLQYDTTSLITLIANVSIRMMFILTMLYIMLKVSDWVIEQAGGMAVTLVSRGAASIAGGGFRTAASFGAFAGRTGIGRPANALANSTGFSAWAKNSGVLGKTLWRGSVGLSKGTYDIRNAPGAGAVGSKQARNLMNTTLVDAGKASTRNAAATAEANAKLDKRLDKQAAANAQAQANLRRTQAVGSLVSQAKREQEERAEGVNTLYRQAGDERQGAYMSQATAARSLVRQARQENRQNTVQAAALAAALSGEPNMERSKLPGMDARRAAAPAVGALSVGGLPTRAAPAAAAAAVTPPASAVASSMRIIPNLATARPEAKGPSRASVDAEIKSRAEGAAAAKTLYQQAAAEQGKAGFETKAEEARKTAQAGVTAAALSGQPNMAQSARAAAAMQAPAELHAPAPTQAPSAVPAPAAAPAVGARMAPAMPQRIEVNMDAIKEQLKGMRKYMSKLDHKQKERLATMAEEMQGHIAKATKETNSRLEHSLERKLNSREEQIARLSGTSSSANNPDDRGGPGGAAASMPIPKEAPQDEDDIPPHYRIAAE